MRRVDLWLSLHAQLLEYRHQDLAESADGILRLPHVDHAKAVRSFTCNMGQVPVDGPVRRGHELVAAGAKPSDRLFVLARA
jgi:hypothetical protein